eukprot:67986_1
MKWEKGKGMKRAIDGNINIGGMKGDKSLAIDAKKEENGNVVVWRKRGKKNKNMNEDNYVELREGRRDRDDDEKEVQEGKDNLNTVKDQREDVQPDEDAELSSSGTESEEPDQDDEAIVIDGEEEEDADEADEANELFSFDFVDPHERFLNGMVPLLKDFLPGSAQFLPDALAQLIVSQPSVGTMVSQEGEGDVFSFVTVLPVQFYAQNKEPVMQAIRDFLLKSVCSQHRSAFTEVLGEGKSTGLVVHEQMLNLPLAIVHRMYLCLQEDIGWALENEISESHKKKFKFENFIIISRCTLNGVPFKPTDEILHDSASFSFTVDDKVAMLQFTVLVITPDAFWSSLNALEQSVS